MQLVDARQLLWGDRCIDVIQGSCLLWLGVVVGWWLLVAGWLQDVVL